MFLVFIAQACHMSSNSASSAAELPSIIRIDYFPKGEDTPIMSDYSSDRPVEIDR
jgi:hypothetical protein